MKNFDWGGLAMWVLGACMASSVWFLAWEKKHEPPPPDLTWVARVEALEKRADEQAKIRCLNVTTDRMDMAIFPVENLGKKVVKP